jgi:1,2-phenylacetyl-CoA epoxidase PaaB subunit
MIGPQATAEGDVYEVFARFTREQPLRHLGSVVAPDVSLARLYARTLYDEWSWSDMIIVPRRDIHVMLAAR